MDEVFFTSNKEKLDSYEEPVYSEYDMKAIQQKSSIFVQDPELEELKKDDTDEDEEKKPLESDEDELVRRLKFLKLNKASDHCA